MFVLYWHIEQRISGMVGGNIGFSISDMRAPEIRLRLLGGDSETNRGPRAISPSPSARTYILRSHKDASNAVVRLAELHERSGFYFFSMRLENVEQFIWWDICAVTTAKIEQRLTRNRTFFDTRLVLQLKNDVLASINSHHSLPPPYSRLGRLTKPRARSGRGRFCGSL
jgi:hypothetical protein